MSSAAYPWVVFRLLIGVAREISSSVIPPSGGTTRFAANPGLAGSYA